MAVTIHPFYAAHRDALDAAMRQRLDLAEPMVCARTHLADIAAIRREMLDEFEIVLTQMPYVGGAASRMTEFFMRLTGFMAISRVLHRHGVPPSIIGDIERETYKAQLLTVPEEERLDSGRHFMSVENQQLLREQAATSATETHQKEFPEDFVYDFVEPSPGDHFDFGIDYKACGFCKFAARHGDREILPNICGLDFDAYATRGIHLERTQTLAGGATHCNFRFSRLQPDEHDGPARFAAASRTRKRR
ncbi:L-2-amino-thiazoline-4-carboxylic acid hydrolase [Bradyrhizobium oligotrophicum]|uniref:L-2-amino-thiazoline-4-carboxylic acid hydrolase n=1 Tax=Bradyrhizobium oligotrophicum TaxID=44255 RepID=UPI003EBED35F